MLLSVVKLVRGEMAAGYLGTTEPVINYAPETTAEALPQL